MARVMKAEFSVPARLSKAGTNNGTVCGLLKSGVGAIEPVWVMLAPHASVPHASSGKPTRTRCEQSPFCAGDIAIYLGSESTAPKAATFSEVFSEVSAEFLLPSIQARS